MLRSVTAKAYAEDRAGQVRIPAGRRYGFPRTNSEKRPRRPPGAEAAATLLIVTNVGKHKFLERKGDNIYVTVPIASTEAALGARIEVPTVEGKAQLKIPAGTESGQKFRLRERGFPAPKPEATRRPVYRGQDHPAESDIRGDKTGSLQQFEKLNPENPRKVMGLE